MSADNRAAGLGLANLFAHVFGTGPVSKDLLRVDAPAPEDHVLSKVPLQRGGFHPGGAYLHRVQNVDTHLYQVRDQLAHRAAGVQEDLCLGLGPQKGEKVLLARLEDLPVRLGRDQRAVLRPQIIAFHDHVDVRPHLSQRLFPVGDFRFQDNVSDATQ